jgi:putative ATPase
MSRCRSVPTLLPPERIAHRLCIYLSVFTLNKLSPPELEQILKNALDSYPPPLPRIPPTLLAFLAEVSDGDARQALNSLELAMSVCLQKDRGRSKVDEEAIHGEVDGESEARAEAEAKAKAATDAEDEELMSAIKRGLRKGYDRTGEERYDMISALHKSIRGSDGSAALYWLAR